MAIPSSTATGPLCSSPSYLLAAGVVIFLALIGPIGGGDACPLLQRRGLCAADNATAPRGASAGRCGDHAVRCSADSRWEIRFYGEGGWHRVMEFSYEDRVLVVKDADVNALLTHYDCGLVYNFTPAPAPLPRPAAFQGSLRSGSGVFNCQLGAYDFSKDVFTRVYNSTGCGGYDLYYAFEYEGKVLPDARCRKVAGAVAAFQWRLQLDEPGLNLTVRSAGISHQRKLLPECFGCRISRGDCSPAAAGNAAACSCTGTCTDAQPGMSSTKMKLVIGAVISGFLLSWVCILYCFRWRIRHFIKKWRSSGTTKVVEEFLQQYGSLGPKRFDYWEIKRMTTSFSRSLGRGGYGKVFKGQLDDGRPVAVKLLNESSKGSDGEEFVNEVASIGRTYHVNIVALLGFCSEGRKRALVYEYMPNGSLEKYIFSDAGAVPPRDLAGWTETYEIAVGVARGMEYLHRGCNIVHFDIKPQNILLDRDLCPKISDFGLAKLCRPKESVLSMAGARGTVGYIAPEVFSRNFGVVSAKSDVYSYGMMLMEMVSRRKNVDARLDADSTGGEVYFPHLAYEQLAELGRLRIPELTDEMEEIARKMVVVGLWCIQTNPRSRPSMSSVVEMLQGSNEGLPMPPKPYLSSPTPSCYSSSSSNSSARSI